MSYIEHKYKYYAIGNIYENADMSECIWII